MRIAYGVHGYGRGHGVRVAGVLPDLLSRHELLVFAGGHAVELLAPTVPVEPIPFLRYAYEGSRLSAAATLRTNGGLLADLLGRGPVSRATEARLERFAPAAVVSDSEPFVLSAARRLGIPTVSFDHVGVIAHCRPEAPPGAALQLWRDARLYDALLGPVDRAVVSSFYPAPPRRRGVHVVPPVLRREVRDAAPSEGSHLLVYFNQPHLLTPRALRALTEAAVPCLVYGEREGREGPLTFRRTDPRRFVEDLAACRALVCTAGHQLASEALHLGKPMLLLPEASAEQRLNARELERLGVGRALAPPALDAAVLRAFLDGLPAHREHLALVPRDGQVRALATLDATLSGLRHAARRPSLPALAGWP